MFHYLINFWRSYVKKERENVCSLTVSHIIQRCLIQHDFRDVEGKCLVSMGYELNQMSPSRLMTEFAVIFPK